MGGDQTGHGWRNRKYQERNYYRVTLECGCTQKVRTQPFPDGRYTCKSGLAHGSNMRWVRAEDPRGGMDYNRRGPEAHLRRAAVEAARAKREAELGATPVQEPLPAFAPRTPGFTLSLVCGCSRPVKKEPFPNERFACPRRGRNCHGVSIAWWQAEDGQRLIRNSAVEKPVTAEVAPVRTEEPPSAEVPAPRVADPDAPWWTRDRFQVRMECGCTRWDRNEPHPGATFPCNSGQAHGYRIRWVSTQRSDGTVRYNRAIENSAAEQS